MAHQAYAIPWQTLADNFKYMHCNPRNRGITNLYLRQKTPGQGKQLQHFVRGFSRALSDYSTIERKKYVAHPTIPELDEVVISEDAVKRMAKTVLQYKTNTYTSNTPDVLSPYERTVRRFVNDTGPGEGDMNSSLFDACEQTKTMLLYGEMDALFRLAAHPRVYFQRLWDERQYANSYGFGLSKLVNSTLQAYICLNVVFIKPELYDAASREEFVERETKANRKTLQPEQYNYRLTAAYQRMLLCCTGVPYGAGYYEVHTYPHREFFGIPRGMFQFEYADSQYGHWQKRNLGTQRIPELVDSKFRGIHVASKADIPVVVNLLRIKGLPAELILHIMEMADYVPIGRTIVRDDPLHMENAEELKKYLSYCWKLLVRIDMLCKANGRWLDWEAEITDTLHMLFEMDFPSQSRVENIPYRESDISGRCQSRVFISQ